MTEIFRLCCIWLHPLLCPTVTSRELRLRLTLHELEKWKFSTTHSTLSNNSNYIVLKCSCGLNIFPRGRSQERVIARSRKRSTLVALFVRMNNFCVRNVLWTMLSIIMALSEKCASMKATIEICLYSIILLSITEPPFMTSKFSPSQSFCTSIRLADYTKQYRFLPHCII